MLGTTIKKWMTSWFDHHSELDKYIFQNKIPASTVLNAHVSTDEDIKYVISNNKWVSNTPKFEVIVRSPVKLRKMCIAKDGSMHSADEFVSYSIISFVPNDELNPERRKYTKISVSRRYSDFEWLHLKLSRLFGSLIQMPNLPTKHYSKRQESLFIEKRRRGLERYINQLVGHPVIRSTDFMMNFLSCGGEMESDIKKSRVDKIINTRYEEPVDFERKEVGIVFEDQVLS
jgi:hypothetical protein